MNKPAETTGAALPEISQLEKKLFSAILYASTIAEEDCELLRLWLPEKLKSLFESIMASKHKGDNGPTRGAQELTLAEREPALTQAQAPKELTGVHLTHLFERTSPEEKEFLSGLLMQIVDEQLVPLEESLVQFYKKQWKIAVHDVKLRVYEAQQTGDTERVTLLLTAINELKKKDVEKGYSMIKKIKKVRPKPKNSPKIKSLRWRKKQKLLLRQKKDSIKSKNFCCP